ncbi:hypothetical protein GCK72_018805 [Caenorhabditis remanei]|uniref:Uncharacterized protein n=1 Tax=Caenorhabditis remanei TaxID=31234 RepID=A0A6A5GC09_CAERE|nr:hypothetical protein GCK72_018805 [Caenorhabditis remanei]KAF1752251.1 hypothetical protein GCK72_018805 [Caenorhabditis remanei]
MVKMFVLCQVERKWYRYIEKCQSELAFRKRIEVTWRNPYVVVQCRGCYSIDGRMDLQESMMVQIQSY